MPIDRAPKAASISPSVLAFRIWSCTAFRPRRVCASLMMLSVFGFFGFTSSATTLAWGTSSHSSSSRFGIQFADS